MEEKKKLQEDKIEKNNSISKEDSEKEVKKEEKKNESKSKHSSPKKVHSKLKELEKTVKEQKKTIEDLKKSIMWLRSDCENYKNSSRREMQKITASANEKLISKLLAWIDNFERALNHLKEVDEDAYKGFSMIFKSMIKIFEDEGLKQLNPKGEKFDVFEHEAIAKEETDEVEEWTIVNVVSNGYKLNGKLIKPAKVVVAVKPQPKKGE
jgi:molecular chaperone GrpE